MPIKLYDPNFKEDQDRYKRIHNSAGFAIEIREGKSHVKLNEGPSGLAPAVHVFTTDDVTLAYLQIKLGVSTFEATGSAKRHPKDEDDKEYGRALALKRAFEGAIDAIDEWLKAADRDTELDEKIGQPLKAAIWKAEFGELERV